jgi:hypothetical protein
MASQAYAAPGDASSRDDVGSSLELSQVLRRIAGRAMDRRADIQIVVQTVEGAVDILSCGP